MTDSGFVEALRAQVGNEFAASQQYIAVAAYYDAETLPRLAGFFYQQAVEERNHALMIVQYLMDAGEEAPIPGVAAPSNEYSDVVAPVAMALAQEKTVSDQIANLARLARDAGDYQGEQFTQWFIKEQVEEVASMSDLLNVVERARENPLLAEEYLARESIGEAGEDPTAPRVAGGAL